MLNALQIRTNDHVVEFAPGMGATARLTLDRRPASYVAVEREEAAAVRVGHLLAGPNQRCVLGMAQNTGLPTGSATVVYGEAMLTMQPPAAKDQILAEAARLLQPGGRYGIHEMTLTPDDIDNEKEEEVSRAFGQAIHHFVRPLTVAAWRELFAAHGFTIKILRTAPMHLLEPYRVIRDEGLYGAARFAFNVLRNREARTRVLNLRKLFRAHENHVGAIMIVAVKN
jgi:hypothetical protein